MYNDPTGHSVGVVLLAIWLSGIAIHERTLAYSYIGCAIASIWDPVIRSDMNNIHWDPFNTDANETLKMTKVSFYKGSAVWGFKNAHLSSFGFGGMIFFEEDDRKRSDAVTTLQHEQGHNMQELIIGTPAYFLFVGVPSMIYCEFGDYQLYNKSASALADRMYYSKIWERTADRLGGVNRNNYDAFWTRDNFVFW